MPYAIVEGDGSYHGIVADISQREQLADPRRREVLREEQRRLTAEERLFPGSKDVVEVGEYDVELVGIGIPP